MCDFQRSSKVTGVNYLNILPTDIIIKIKLKAQDSIVSLPKFEEFNKSKDTGIELDRNVEEYNFNWQEKVFNSQELQYYSDKSNCVSNNDLRYHDLIRNNESTYSYVFTYVNEDNFCPLPFENDGDEREQPISKLKLYLDKLRLRDKDEMLTNKTDSMRHLFRSEEDISLDTNQWTSMHVMFDNSKYDDDLQLLIKQEAILISLYWNESTRCLVLKPDVNTMDWNPYNAETVSGVRLNYQYAVELKYGEDSSQDVEEFKTLLKQLQRKWDKKHRHLLDFIMPPLGIRRHFFTLEILSAKGFDMDNLYIDYKVEIPDGVVCNNETLQGRTQTSKCNKNEAGALWNFAHLVELQFDCQVDIADEPNINIIFEIISRDWWGRHRTEGYGHMKISLHPGRGTKLVSTARPEESNRVDAESRRFFLGGCHLLKDLDVLNVGQKFMNPNFKLVSSGSIKVRWHTIRQSTTISRSSSMRSSPGCSASALMHGADAVLRQYRKAKARLAAATKDLDVLKEDKKQ